MSSPPESVLHSDGATLEFEAARNFDHGLRDGGDDPAEVLEEATWVSRFYREGAFEGVPGAAFHGPRWAPRAPHGELDGEAGGKLFSGNDGKGDAPEVGGFDGELDAAAASTRGTPGPEDQTSAACIQCGAVLIGGGSPRIACKFGNQKSPASRLNI